MEDYLTREPSTWDFPDTPEEQAPEQAEQELAPVTITEDFQSFTFEDYLNTDEPMKMLARVKSNYQRERLLTRMEVHAKGLGYKKLRADWKAYYGEQKALMHRSDDNVVEDIPSRYHIDLDCGAWISDQNGVRCYKGETEEIVCPHPIFPIERYEDIETGDQKLKIAFQNGRRWKTAIVPKTALFSGKNVEALASQGAAVTQKSSKLLSQYLAEVETKNYDVLPEYLTTKHMGYFENYGFVPYIDDLLFDGDPMYGPLFDSITQKGDFETWKSHVARLWNHSVEVRIAVAASFASPLLHLLNVQPFFVHLNSGQSGTGKTVALMVGASVWGNPANGHYIQTFNGTKASMEYTAGFLNHLPLFIDELQLAKDGNGNLKFSVYDLTEGIGRGRAQKTGGIRKSERWQNVFITSGESELVSAADGAGAFNRVLNIEFLDPIIEDGAETADLVRQNYGWAGKQFVEMIYDDDMQSGIKKQYEMYLSELTRPGKKKISGKQANAAGAVLMAAFLANVIIWKCALEPLTVEQISEYLQDEREISVGKRAYDFLLDWIGTNVNSFVDEHPAGSDGQYQVRSVQEIKGQLYGKIRTDGVTLIIKSVLEKALMDNGYSPAPAYKWLRANGKLALSKGTSNMQSIGGSLVRCVPIYTDVHDFTTSRPDVNPLI